MPASLTMQFLKENWLWIFVPFFAVLLLFAILMFVGESEGSPFVYSIF